MVHGPVAMVILDGWGLRDQENGNAVAMARTPTMDRLWKTYPRGTLLAHGEHVGLGPGQMGNSNVGHLNLGAGRIVPGDLLRINRSISDGSFMDNPVLNAALQQRRAGTVHLYGLVSDGGVHSHMDHLRALLSLARRNSIRRLRVHAMTDGRDTPPRSALLYLDTLSAWLGGEGAGADWTVATVMGRYYGMDRDHRWDRTKAASAALVRGQGRRASGAAEAVEMAYHLGESDEFIVPTVITGPDRQPAVIGEGDSVIAFNFRADRARQLARCLGETGESVGEGRRGWSLATFTRYGEDINSPVAFPPELVTEPLGEVISRAELLQLRAAETEKYAHVTYFFNGGREEPFPGEERILVDSPPVATYDQLPGMCARELTAAVKDEIARDRYQFVLVNYANADMVGHTGNLEAAIGAVEAVDQCLGVLLDSLLNQGFRSLVLSDHGNAEKMLGPGTTGPHTAHTNYPVPVVMVDPSLGPGSLGQGILADAPVTVLDMLGLKKPGVMTARSLVPR